MPFKKLKSKNVGNKKTARKLVIKNLKKATKLPDNFEETTWARLAAAVDAIHTAQPVADSLEQLYRGVEALCSNGLAANLYDRLCRKLAQRTGGPVYESLQGLSPTDEGLLNLDRAWTEHCDQLLLVRNIFLYLDRSYVLASKGASSGGGDDAMLVDQPTRLSLWDMALGNFRELILLKNNAALLGVVRDGILQLVSRDRSGADVDRPLARRMMRMLATLGLYSEHLEPQLLRNTKSHYQEQAMQLSAEFTLAPYMLRVQQLLSDEARRIDQYIDERTRRPLIAALEATLLRWPGLVEALCTDPKRGLPHLCSVGGFKDLNRVYRLLGRRGVDRLPELRACWCKFVEGHARELVMDKAREPTLLTELLAFRVKLDEAHRSALKSDATLVSQVRDALERAINVRATRVAQLAAKHADSLLRSGVKLSSEEVETALGALVSLFRLLRAKDVFEAFYGKFLAKRLLLSRSASEDAERSMLARLKAEVGAQYTGKLEGMFRDQASSKAAQEDFQADEKAQAELKALSAPPLEVHVLTHGFWPQYAPIECKVPEKLASMLEVFRKFYNRAHSGRRLNWQFGLSQCTLRAMFPRGKKELGASMFQSLVFLAFNAVPFGKPLSIGELLTATGLPRDELNRTLLSLSSKVPLLRRKKKEEMETDTATAVTPAEEKSTSKEDARKARRKAVRPVADDDLFYVNTGFRAKMVRLKINTIQVRESKADMDKTQKSVVQNRQYQIDAAIVRIMKSRKTLTHINLTKELFAQLKFPVEASDLKKRIDSLLEREYLEHADEEGKVYNYLA